MAVYYARYCMLHFVSSHLEKMLNIIRKYMWKSADVGEKATKSSKAAKTFNFVNIFNTATNSFLCFLGSLQNKIN